MRILPEMEAIWRRGDFTGPTRPMARVTIERPKMALRTYGLLSKYSIIAEAPSGIGSATQVLGQIDPNHGRRVANTYADLLFTAPGTPVELLNVKTLSWVRSLDQDAATLTLTLANTAPRDETTPVPSGAAGRDLDYPGWYTPDRGQSQWSARWGHVKNSWAGLIRPDNLIKTYEGYGLDVTAIPEEDANLVQTGVWLIDTVQINAFGVITVQARDLARLLLDHQTNQPVVPKDFDPLEFINWDDAIVPTPPVRTRIPLKVRDHSGRYGPYKQGDGTFIDNIPDPDRYRGHTPQDSIDDNPDTFWMSFAHIKPRWPWGVEWIEYSLPGSRVGTVAMWLIGSGYQVYVSVYADGHWLDEDGNPATGSTKTIPFTINPEGGRDQHAGIPYRSTFVYRADGNPVGIAVDFPPADKVTRIRLSFKNLQHLPGITPREHSYRVAVRTVAVESPLTAGTRKISPGPAGANPGRMEDYTDIIKLACAWAGFYWPTNAYITRSDGTQQYQRFTQPDPVLATAGRVWGDFEQTGTAAVAKIEDALVNKSLMDVVNYVRNIIGFVFYIAEDGAVQWRLPNIFDLGNTISDNSDHVGRTKRVFVIDERENLTALDATLSSHDLREQIRVKNAAKEVTTAGYNPNNIGLRRVLLWADDRFEERDLKRASELTALASLFTYRTDRTKIPGFPGIQLDDQVRIMERVTNEGSVHYVSGISSDNDLEAGTWNYTLSTHWLGENPQTRWMVPRPKLPSAAIIDTTTHRVRQQFRRPA